MLSLKFVLKLSFKPGLRANDIHYNEIADTLAI